MPFSLLPARCIYVAKQTLQYRRDVIQRIVYARVAAHTTLFTFAGAPVILKNIQDKK
jgi:hypothetical protein